MMLVPEIAVMVGAQGIHDAWLDQEEDRENARAMLYAILDDENARVALLERLKRHEGKGPQKVPEQEMDREKARAMLSAVMKDERRKKEERLAQALEHFDRVSFGRWRWKIDDDTIVSSLSTREVARITLAAIYPDDDDE